MLNLREVVVFLTLMLRNSAKIHLLVFFIVASVSERSCKNEFAEKWCKLHSHRIISRGIRQSLAYIADSVQHLANLVGPLARAYNNADHC